MTPKHLLEVSNLSVRRGARDVVQQVTLTVNASERMAPDGSGKICDEYALKDSRVKSCQIFFFWKVNGSGQGQGQG